jgi:pimeloyl-ACP methyl ester carboxylesterase
VTSIDQDIDVSKAIDAGINATVRVTIHLPSPHRYPRPSIVCFAFPGAGYGRKYFSFAMPGDNAGQAKWHTDRGWVFVECDHLGVGDSTIPGRGVLTIARGVLANKAAVEAVLQGLAAGTISADTAPIADPVVIAIGQSMGGLVTIALEGQFHRFDGIATLGFSGIQTILPERPGHAERPFPWFLRSAEGGIPVVTNGVPLEPVDPSADAIVGQMTYAFHHESEPADVVEYDMLGDPNSPSHTIAPWRSADIPDYAAYGVSPGVVATEAASITVPVLVAVGERDVVLNPLLEPYGLLTLIAERPGQTC